MPKRIIDGDALWASSKLARCPEWMIPEYAWLYPLCDGNGSFEINLKVIHGKVSPIRPHFSIDDLQNILREFHRHGLLFLWDEGAKRYGHWTASELPGRLPPASQRDRYQFLAPKVPKDLLDKYMREYREHQDNIRTSVGVGFGFGLVLEGVSKGVVEGLGGGGSVGSSVVVTAADTNTETSTGTAAAAFSSIGFDNPFGHPDFQAVWLRRFASRNGEYLTAVMESTIQECYREKIGIPPQFFEAKHDVEKREQIEFEQKFGKAAPL
jgi:hypothetical protein